MPDEVDIPVAFAVFSTHEIFTNCLVYCQQNNLDVTDHCVHLPAIVVYDHVDALVLLHYIESEHLDDQCIFCFC